MSDAPKTAGAPMWMVTFADLMALLLTMFVLLLSFAEMNVQRYQQIAGNMRGAFGLQYIKKLAGIIEDDGGPLGKAAKVNVPRVVQELRVGDKIGDRPVETPEAAPEETLAQSLEKAMHEEISQAMAKVEEREGEVVVRFPEKIAFPSGAETLTTEFLVALNNLSSVISKTEGDIIIAGHTDDRPISTARFRSNWDLSAARANSVIHYLLEFTDIAPSRLAAMGYADSRPLVANDTDENRAINRRVEIIIRKSGTEAKPPAAAEGAPEASADTPEAMPAASGEPPPPPPQ